MKLKKLAALGAALVMGVSMTACGSQSASEIPVATNDESMRIVCYSTPQHPGSGGAPWGEHPDYNTEENWQNIANAGFNYAIPIFDVTHEQILCTLENAQKVGIKVLIMDYLTTGIPQIIKRSENKNYNETMATIEAVEDEIIARYSIYTEYESFAGLSVFDEPSATYYDAIAAGQDWWREHFPEYEYYVNLLPSYASYAQLFGASAPDNYRFNDYVEQFVEKTNPDYISYDHYALLRSGLSGMVRTGYLADLEVFANTSKKYNIPFWCYQLCSKHWSYIGPETYREYAWQIYTALAYGAQGVQTFQYWSYMMPENNPDNLGTGFVDPDGNLMPLYYAGQTVNNELIALQEYYMAYDWQGTMPVGISGGGAYAMLSSPLEKLYGVRNVESSGDAIIGEFKAKNGSYGYMVTNYTSPFINETINLSMTFENANRVLVIKKGKKVVYDLTKHVLDLSIGSGEGYFVIPIN